MEIFSPKPNYRPNMFSSGQIGKDGQNLFSSSSRLATPVRSDVDWMTFLMGGAYVIFEGEIVLLLWPRDRSGSLAAASRSCERPIVICSRISRLARHSSVGSVVVLQRG